MESLTKNHDDGKNSTISSNGGSSIVNSISSLPEAPDALLICLKGLSKDVKLKCKSQFLTGIFGSLHWQLTQEDCVVCIKRSSNVDAKACIEKKSKIGKDAYFYLALQYGLRIWALFSESFWCFSFTV